LLGLCGFATPAKAQFTSNNGDPFFLYYGWFLPRQQALAMQPRPANTVNALATIRQDSAFTDRAGLFAGATSRRTYDPNTLFEGPANGRRRGGMAAIGGMANGAGPPRFYNRTSAYYQGMRPGQGVNPSIAVGAAGATPRSGGRGPTGGGALPSAAGMMGMSARPGF
jgi:hypothetical protein